MQQGQRAQVVVVGNAKGGSGKSTVAMHIIGRLLALDKQVAAIDLDGRQGTLSQYADNRERYGHKHGLDLPLPAVHRVVPSNAATREQAQEEDRSAVVAALERVVGNHDVVVLDCPGNDGFLARLGHLFADTLVTPLNDSFIDFDLLAAVDPETYRVAAPSWYSEMVWEYRKQRYVADGHELDWVVLRNRVGHISSRNEKRLATAMQKLATRIGFRCHRGLGDRVIFRELFLNGLTLSDLSRRPPGVEVTMGHVAAHIEVRDLVAALQLKCLQPAPAETPSQPIAAAG